MGVGLGAARSQSTLRGMRAQHRTAARAPEHSHGSRRNGKGEDKRGDAGAREGSGRDRLRPHGACESVDQRQVFTDVLCEVLDAHVLEIRRADVVR